MLSDMFSQFGTCLIIWLITSWKYSLEGQAPTSGVRNAVWRDSSASMYPCDKSTSVNIVAPFTFCRMSSTVGICTRRHMSA